MTHLGELAALGSATVYEAAGRAALSTRPDPGRARRLARRRPARTVRCGQDDNLMVHAAMAELEPGEVLVLTMPEPAPGRAVRRAAGDAGRARRRRAARRRRRARRRGARRRSACRSGRAGSGSAARRRPPGAIGEPVGRRRRTIRPGDAVVLDADGAAVVRAERVDEVLGPRASAPRRSAGSARSSRPAPCPTTSTASAPRRGPLMAAPRPTSRTSITPSCSRPGPRRACASSSTSSGWRSRRRRASRSTCAAGATTSATASS